jgi:hypothetical protein
MQAGSNYTAFEVVRNRRQEQLRSLPLSPTAASGLLVTVYLPSDSSADASIDGRPKRRCQRSLSERVEASSAAMGENPCLWHWMDGGRRPTPPISERIAAEGDGC